MPYEKKTKKVKDSLVERNPMEYDYECEEDLKAVARAFTVNSDPKRLEKVKKLAKSKLEESMRKKDEAQKLIDLGQEK